MKLRYFLIPLLLMVLTGCTRNNGDIGKWFGKWQLQEMTIDGTVDEACSQGTYFWDFQNDIIRIDHISTNEYLHEVRFCVGTWKQPSENTMILDFNHGYEMSNELHIPTDKPYTFTIVSQSGKNCVMKRVDESTGTEYCYYLRKR